VRRQSEAATALYVRQTSVCRFGLSKPQINDKLKFVGQQDALRLPPHSK
jgi:hypothetical protein